VIADEKILVTGVTGMVASPLARHLARDNEVWGVARFTDPALRADLEQSGIRTHGVDLAEGDLAGFPEDFTYVLHLAWTRAGIDQLENAIRSNVEGAGLVLHHCRRAKAALVMSGMGVYSPSGDPWHAYTESDPVGRAATAYAPTSPASKLGLEAVARFCGRAFDLPVTITRLNTWMGGPGSFPGMHISAVLDGRPMVAPFDPNPHNPIHTDDMLWQLEPLLDAASTRAFITNWCGDDVTTAQDWMRWAGEWSGRDAHLAVRQVPCSPAGTLADATRRRSVTGPCRTSFPQAFRDLYDSMTAESDRSRK
jgi:nucleoside-diphosphate-sugar epimerase